MRKKIFGLLIVFVVTLNFVFIMNVNAANYEENAFTEGQCIDTDIWQEYAQTGYELDATSGTYKLTGDKYSSDNATTNHVYYVVSPDGKILGAFVPNYDAAIADTTLQAELFNKGIVTTSKCSGTYAMIKTVVGNPPTAESVIEGVEIDSQGTDATSADETNNDEDINNSTPSNSNEEGSDTTVEKLESPNTASPMAITAIIASLVLVGAAVYSYLSKVKPELFKKNK